MDDTYAEHKSSEYLLSRTLDAHVKCTHHGHSTPKPINHQIV